MKCDAIDTEPANKFDQLPRFEQRQVAQDCADVDHRANSNARIPEANKTGDRIERGAIRPFHTSGEIVDSLDMTVERNDHGIGTAHECSIEYRFIKVRPVSIRQGPKAEATSGGAQRK